MVICRSLPRCFEVFFSKDKGGRLSWHFLVLLYIFSIHSNRGNYFCTWVYARQVYSRVTVVRCVRVWLVMLMVLSFVNGGAKKACFLLIKLINGLITKFLPDDSYVCLRDTCRPSWLLSLSECVPRAFCLTNIFWQWKVSNFWSNILPVNVDY